MKKIMLTAGFLALSSTAFAAGDISPKCEEYFTVVDGFVEMLSGHEEAAGQLDMMKAQFDEAKKQVAELPLEQQEMACQAGLEGMAEAQKMMMMGE